MPMQPRPSAETSRSPSLRVFMCLLPWSERFGRTLWRSTRSMSGGLAPAAPDHASGSHTAKPTRPMGRATAAAARRCPRTRQEVPGIVHSVVEGAAGSPEPSSAASMTITMA